MKNSNQKTNKILLTFIHCLAPLMMGGLLYILFRSTTLRMFNWFTFLGIDEVIFSARANVSGIKNYLPNWIFYSLPDGLWVYSFSSALLILWDGKLTAWILIPLFTGAFVEIAQGVGVFPGIFDMIDLVFTLAALILSITIINHKFKQNEKTIS